MADAIRRKTGITVASGSQNEQKRMWLHLMKFGSQLCRRMTLFLIMSTNLSCGLFVQQVKLLSMSTTAEQFPSVRNNEIVGEVCGLAQRSEQTESDGHQLVILNHVLVYFFFQGGQITELSRLCGSLSTKRTNNSTALSTFDVLEQDVQLGVYLCVYLPADLRAETHILTCCQPRLCL